MGLTKREPLFAAGAGVGETTSFDENWMCTMQKHEDDWTQILASVAHWRYGFEHPTRKGFYVDDMFFSRDGDSTHLWEASISYTDDWPDEPDPRKRPATYSLSSLTHGYHDLLDADGKPFINTAGDFLDDVPEKKIAAWRITIKKNLPKRWPQWLLNFNEAVNKSSVKVAGIKWPKETLKIADLNIGDIQEENKIEFTQLQIVVEYHPKTWAVQSINRGIQERVIELGFFSNEPEFIKRAVLNKKREPVDKPVFLDAEGTAIREKKKTIGGTETYDPDSELKSKFDPKEKEIVILKNWNNPRLEFKDLPILSK